MTYQLQYGVFGMHNTASLAFLEFKMWAALCFLILIIWSTLRIWFLLCALLCVSSIHNMDPFAFPVKRVDSGF